MIAYIEGEIREITAQTMIIDVHGIGYEVICPNPYRFQAQIGQKQKVFTYHYVREDAQILYGFQDQEEKSLFSKILNVSGIGPKGALAVLATSSVQDFVVAIEQEDEEFLTTFPGVGKKTARQMILDLKGKLPFEYREDHLTSKNNAAGKDNHALLEAIEALKSLGYSEREIYQIKLQLAQEQSDTADTYIRKGLALLMK
ncbi:Holliday junction DNA helicase RuvA [Gracilibacillus boraciitolerans JCM 21714]|uniref:Holliday junction branch migration complex subunit RuvA n=1 Tax=Gracilibacillus boraciitolerans JCM 21714 TaxID=1298598 RepID=W4VMS7_9BACI|nr:Holliday junction branch migration protein RuvA [Gracilibacillus boraciitolerans]GAE94153.1 Holliday junction DNA helicase RuvA [Gracilibacillus boraciitolerans JCM 21714]